MSQTEQYNEQISGISIAPRLYYEIISSCNLTCTHCNDAFSAYARRIDPDSLLAFHSEFANLYGRDGQLASVVTGGEPTLHTDLKRIVEGLGRFGPVVVTTNGTTPKAGKLLKELMSEVPNLSVQVSVDGASRKTFEAIRGEGTWDKVCAFLEGLAKAGLGDRMGLSMTPMQSNRHEVEDVIAKAKSLGIGTVYFPTLLPAGKARENWGSIAFSPVDTIQLLNGLGERMANRASKPRISSNTINQVLARLLNGWRADCLTTFSLKVDCDGIVLPCPATGRKDAALGNIADPELVKSLYARLEVARMRWLPVSARPDENCTSCSVHEYCGGHFCASCQLLAPPDAAIVSDACTVLKHHFNGAKAAKSSLDAEQRLNQCESRSEEST